MSKVILNLAVSLDGFIAKEDGSVDWLDDLDTGGSDLGFHAFLQSIGAIITGRISFEHTQKLNQGTWPFIDTDTYVITRKMKYMDKNITSTSEDLTELVIRLKQQNQANIWLFGGGNLIKEFRDLNLIDEYIITTIPVMLGTGISLFQDSKNFSNLEVVYSIQSKNIIQTHYRVSNKNNL